MRRKTPEPAPPAEPVAPPAGPTFNPILTEYLGDCRRVMERWCCGPKAHRMVLERERRTALAISAARAQALANGIAFGVTALGRPTTPLPAIELDVADLEAIDAEVERCESARLSLVAIAAGERAAVSNATDLVAWVLYARAGRALVRRLAVAGFLPPAPPGAFPAPVRATPRPDHAGRGERLASAPRERENAFDAQGAT